MAGMPSGALGALLGVSQVLYLAAMLGLGGRLLARARRSGERAEVLPPETWRVLASVLESAG